jgi:hypothetical protein
MAVVERHDWLVSALVGFADEVLATGHARRGEPDAGTAARELGA